MNARPASSSSRDKKVRPSIRIKTDGVVTPKHYVPDNLLFHAVEEYPEARELLAAALDNPALRDKAVEWLEQHGARPMEFLEEGRAYFFKTLTFYYIGVVAKKSFGAIVLQGASWISSTGSLKECLMTGKIEEYERLPDDFILSWGVGVGATPWRHALPT